MTQLRVIINYVIVAILGVFAIILTAGLALNLPFENIANALYILSILFLPVTLILGVILYKKAKEDTV